MTEITSSVIDFILIIMNHRKANQERLKIANPLKNMESEYSMIPIGTIKPIIQYTGIMIFLNRVILACSFLIVAYPFLPKEITISNLLTVSITKYTTWVATPVSELSTVLINSILLFVSIRYRSAIRLINKAK